MARSDDDILQQLKADYDRARGVWDEIVKEGDTDMRFVGGDPWAKADREAREKAKRPCLSLDELNQYFNQAINDVRANPLGMKFSPRGAGADDKGAQFYADKAREIEYRSHAQQGYTTAFENAIQRGYGWVRLKTKWVEENQDDPFRQEMWIEPVANPNQVTPDPDFLRPDGSDLRYLFVEESIRKADFLRQHPKAKVRDFSAEMRASAPRWFKGDDTLTQVEYWTVETTERTLLAVKGKGGKIIQVYQDELDGKPAGVVVKERPVEVKTVHSYLSNGVEILKHTEWPGRYIPFACCLGKVLWTTDGGEAKRTILSMTRLARDPQMMLAYYATTEIEVVGQTPRFPYMVYRGTLDTVQKQLIVQSVHEPVPVIEFDPSPDGVAPGTVLPMAQRQPYEPPVQAFEIGKESARRSIQAAMGISPLPTQAQRQNQKSGIALKEMDSAQQRGSYHFKDHYLDMIHHVGVIYEDLVDKIHDTTTDVAVRRADDSSATVRINDENDPNGVSTKGDYLVTVSAGPSDDSTRDAAEKFLDTLAGVPNVFPLVAAEIVRLKQLGPVGDQIADILDLMKPPQVQQMLAAKKQGQAPDANTLMQQMGQMKEQLGQAEQVMQQLKSEADTEQAKQQATLEAAKLKAETDIELQRMKDATSIRVAEIAASSKGYLMEAQHAAQHEEQAGALAHESQEADAGRQHEAQMAEAQNRAAMEQQQAGVEGKAQLQAQAGDQKMQQQEVAGEQQMTLAEQSAKLAQEQAATQTETE
jgi:hypothetical protein